jgi:hypothetical protein
MNQLIITIIIIKKSEEVLDRENIRDYIRKNNGRVHYIDS